MRAWLELHQGEAVGLLVLGIVATGCGPAETEVGQTGEAAFGLVRRDFETIAPRVVIATTPFVVSGQRFVVDPGGRSMLGRLRVELPARAEDAIKMSTDDGFAITVREVDGAGRGRVDRGVVTYPRADGTSMWLGADDGAEEWLYLPQGSSSGRIATYRVTGASLRQHVTAVDIHDAQGRARATVSAPGAWGADGTDVPVWVEAEGDTVVLRTEGAVRGPLLVDPSWVSVGSMGTARRQHSAALLSSGNLLVTGGEQQQGSILLNSAEIYDRVSKTWFPTPPMTAKRSQHCSILLPDGRVFVGCFGVDVGGEVLYAELYDESTGVWTMTAPMHTVQTVGAAAMLMDGRLLVTGGVLVGAPFAEAYDAAIDSWDAVAPPLANRTSHAIIALADARVLIAGGASQSGNKTVEVYESALNMWEAAGSMATARGVIAPLVMLQDGRVLAAGGYDFSGSFSDAEIFDPGSDQWTSTTPMVEDRYGHQTAAFDDGRVLAAGGASTAGLISFKKTTELYDPTLQTWTPYADMNVERAGFTLKRLEDGQLLAAGGDDGAGSVKSTEKLGRPSGVPCADDTDCASDVCSGGICCATACPNLPCGSCAEATGAPEDGTCVLFSGLACDDGIACTLQDACANDGCAGQIIQCPPPGECESKNACAPDSGLCSPVPKSDGTPCSIGVCVGGECSSQATASTNTSASAGGSGVSSSASNTSGTSGGGDAVGEDGPGCGCRLTGEPKSALPPLAPFILAAGAYARRRAARPRS